jgi:hypothetical protein
MRGGTRYLIQALYSAFGNKGYIRELQKLLEEKLKDIEPKDEELLLYLARDITELDDKEQRSSRQAREGRFF